MNACKLTECQNKPRCPQCAAMDAAYSKPNAEELLPHAYLLAKVAMMLPLFEEARDALTAITEQQRVRHGISKTLADRMDVAGTFDLNDWRAMTPNVEVSG